MKADTIQQNVFEVDDMNFDLLVYVNISIIIQNTC